MRNTFHKIYKKIDFAGQGLAEYAILLALIGLIVVFALTIFGGSIQGGLIKVCAALGNEDCQAVDIEATTTQATVTPTIATPGTPSKIPTSTPTLAEPDPTRGPVVVVTVSPTATEETTPLRIKVVLNGKGSKSSGGIQVVLYNSSGAYITEGVTDDKGNIIFSVPSGSYTVSTFYNNVWQKDGPFSVPSPKENVIHR